MEIKSVSINLLKLSDYNPREISEKDFQSLKNSLKEFGFVEPIVANKQNEIIGGHMRFRAAQELGIKEIPVVYVDLPEGKQKLLNLALNRISGRWDREKLEKLIFELYKIKDIDLKLSGFEDWELELYNPGPETEIDGTLEGEIPPVGFTIVVYFDNKEDFEYISASLAKGKKSMNGQILIDLLKK